MAYFKINDTDFSIYVKSLKVNNNNNYSAQTNAAGDTVVDYINSKRSIEVGIIPLEEVAAAALLSAIDEFVVSISFRNPKTQQLEEGVSCIIPSSNVDYYTIQADKVKLNGFNLTFTEL